MAESEFGALSKLSTAYPQPNHRNFRNYSELFRYCSDGQKQRISGTNRNKIPLGIVPRFRCRCSAISLRLFFVSGFLLQKLSTGHYPTALWGHSTHHNPTPLPWRHVNEGVRDDRLRLPQPQAFARYSSGSARLGTHRLPRRSKAHHVDPGRDDQRLPVPQDGVRQG